jgi:hypothetical protein
MSLYLIYSTPDGRRGSTKWSEVYLLFLFPSMFIYKSEMWGSHSGEVDYSLLECDTVCSFTLHATVCPEYGGNILLRNVGNHLQDRPLGIKIYKTDLSASRSTRPTSRHQDLQDRPLGIKIYKTATNDIIAWESEISDVNTSWRSGVWRCELDWTTVAQMSRGSRTNFRNVVGVITLGRWKKSNRTI